MAELSEDQKHAMVVALARYQTPAQVRVMMRDEYELDLEFRQISAYDPNRPSFEGSDKWRTIFEVARKAYLEETATVPIFNQGFRLRVLQEEMEKARKAGNSVLVASLLEQAAKEAGGLLTNARSLNVTDNRKGLSELSVEERREAAMELLREALSKRAEDAAKPIPASEMVIEHQPDDGKTPESR